jgi:hypothetical protein
MHLNVVRSRACSAVVCASREFIKLACKMFDWFQRSRVCHGGNSRMPRVVTSGKKMKEMSVFSLNKQRNRNDPQCFPLHHVPDAVLRLQTVWNPVVQQCDGQSAQLLLEELNALELDFSRASLCSHPQGTRAKEST